MTATPLSVRNPAAVLFDCDGVLADSEGLASRLVAEELTALGWRMTAGEAEEHFLGMALPAMRPVIEARVGPLPPGWAWTLALRIAEAMCREAEPVPGAVEAVRAAVRAGLPVAVASNSGRAELEAKLERLALAGLFAGRVFSFEDVPRPKPAPDVYLAAARSCGARPADCVVVEDSLLGVRAGVSAGCRVLGLARGTDASVLRAAGALPFASMAELPALLGVPPA